MREKQWTYFILSILTLCICIYMQWEPEKGSIVVLYGLAILSLIALKLLLDILEKYYKLRIVILIVVTISLLLIFKGLAVSVCSVLIIEITDETMPRKYYFSVSAVAIILMSLILYPPTSMIIITLMSIIPLYLILMALNKLEDTRDSLESKLAEIASLSHNLEAQKKLIRTTEHATKLKERNRLASKIHDKLGHGISGSILLLEGALLLFEKDRDKSRETIVQATENLRDSVDEIRADLREERSTQSETGLAEIENELNKLNSMNRNVNGVLKTTGNIDNIKPTIWYCIYENMKEAISNMIKHSDATVLSVNITNQNKLVRAEFKDNGKKVEFKTDIGLEAMEERCAILGGQCFFSSDDTGFKIVMTFRNLG